MARIEPVFLHKMSSKWMIAKNGTAQQTDHTKLRKPRKLTRRSICKNCPIDSMCTLFALKTVECQVIVFLFVLTFFCLFVRVAAISTTTGCAKRSVPRWCATTRPPTPSRSTRKGSTRTGPPASRTVPITYSGTAAPASGPVPPIRKLKTTSAFLATDPVQKVRPISYWFLSSTDEDF